MDVLHCEQSKLPGLYKMTLLIFVKNESNAYNSVLSNCYLERANISSVYFNSLTKQYFLIYEYKR